MIDWDIFKNETEAVHWLINYSYASNYSDAKKYMRTHIPKEKLIQDKVIKGIRKLIPSAFVWKTTAGPYSRQGIPDVSAIIHGRYYGFEIKRPLIGKLSEIQSQTIKQMQGAGAGVYVVTGTKELAEILGDEI